MWPTVNAIQRNQPESPREFFFPVSAVHKKNIFLVFHLSWLVSWSGEVFRTLQLTLSFQGYPRKNGMPELCPLMSTSSPAAVRGCPWGYNWSTTRRCLPGLLTVMFMSLWLRLCLSCTPKDSWLMTLKNRAPFTWLTSQVLIVFDWMSLNLASSKWLRWKPRGFGVSLTTVVHFRSPQSLFWYGESLSVPQLFAFSRWF